MEKAAAKNKQRNQARIMIPLFCFLGVIMVASLAINNYAFKATYAVSCSDFTTKATCTNHAVNGCTWKIIDEELNEGCTGQYFVPQTQTPTPIPTSTTPPCSESSQYWQIRSQTCVELNGAWDWNSCICKNAYNCQYNSESECQRKNANNSHFSYCIKHTDENGQECWSAFGCYGDHDYPDPDNPNKCKCEADYARENGECKYSPTPAPTPTPKVTDITVYTSAEAEQYRGNGYTCIQIGNEWYCHLRKDVTTYSYDERDYYQYRGYTCSPTGEEPIWECQCVSEEFVNGICVDYDYRNSADAYDEESVLYYKSRGYSCQEITPGEKWICYCPSYAIYGTGYEEICITEDTSPSPSPTPTVKDTPTVKPTASTSPIPTITVGPQGNCGLYGEYEQESGCASANPQCDCTQIHTHKLTQSLGGITINCHYPVCSSPTPTVKDTPTVKPTVSPTPTVKDTPTVKPTVSPTPTVKDTPTVKPTITSTPKTRCCCNVNDACYNMTVVSCPTPYNLEDTTGNKCNTGTTTSCARINNTCRQTAKSNCENGYTGCTSCVETAYTCNKITCSTNGGDNQTKCGSNADTECGTGNWTGCQYAWHDKDNTISCYGYSCNSNTDTGTDDSNTSTDNGNNNSETENGNTNNDNGSSNSSHDGSASGNNNNSGGSNNSGNQTSNNSSGGTNSSTNSGNNSGSSNQTTTSLCPTNGGESKTTCASKADAACGIGNWSGCKNAWTNDDNNLSCYSYTCIPPEETIPSTSSEVKTCYICTSNAGSQYVWASTNTNAAIAATKLSGITAKDCVTTDATGCEGVSVSNCYECNGTKKHVIADSLDEALTRSGGTSCTIVTTNKCNEIEPPKTGAFGMIVAWIIGLTTIGYAIWYYKKTTSLKKYNKN